MNDFQDKVALVTGASRGIGAEVARQLASYGADVIVNYRSKGARAEQVVEDIRRLGRHALAAQADLTDAAQVQTMLADIRQQFGRIDLLILNASGGMEKEKAADYALTLNRDAQLHTVNRALPLMPPGSRIVFVTSHLAHFYGRMDVSAYPGYEPVAASKKAGEDALRARIGDFAGRGIDLVVVSGDLIEGTITPKLMERMQPGLIEARRQEAGALPTVAEFAQAIVDAAGDATLTSGATILVGQEPPSASASNDMMTLFHICSRSDWQQAQDEGEYRADSLAREGFIHCSTPEQVAGTANRLFRGRQDLLLLQIDRRRVRAEIKEEEGEPGLYFPHIYGPLNLEAVIGTLPFSPDADGLFSFSGRT